MISPLSGSMGNPMRMWRELSSGMLAVAGLTAGAAVSGFSTVAGAQALCVVCSEPDAIYRCQADPNYPRPADNRLNLLCITELARAGNHGTCGVRRQQSACEGPLRTVAIIPSDGAQPAAQPGPLLPGPAPVQPEQTAAPAPARSGPPETVEELAKRTAAQSKQQIESATSAVGNVAKKTSGAVEDAASKSWRCITSLFKDCK
jgi:hypothetical protein